MGYGGVIAARLQKSSRSKQAGTDRSRQDHFLKWCNTVGAAAGGTQLGDIQARNFLIACYAVALVQGETLLSTKIRHNTLKGYIKMACTCHTNLGLPDPRKAPIDLIKIITDAVNKYEKVPNRREMIHDAMYEHMLVLYKKFFLKDPDCFVVSLCEWLFLGRYTGFRREEWCNEKAHEYVRIDDPLWEGNDVRSVAIEDFTFFDTKGAPVQVPQTTWNEPASQLPTNIAFVELCIRKQKNNDNFQKITYSCCHKNPLLCPVYAAFRIHCRGLRLGAPPTYPAAIYWDRSSGSHKLITSRQVNTFLRQTASSTFGIPANSKLLEKWSCHSIRVTAANLLHRAQYSDSYIKNRLRWRSDAFLMYLRNTFYTAKDHTSALALDIAPALAANRRPLEEHEQLIAAAA